jgi:microcystin degradation protein MlrC
MALRVLLGQLQVLLERLVRRRVPSPSRPSISPNSSIVSGLTPAKSLYSSCAHRAARDSAPWELVHLLQFFLADARGLEAAFVHAEVTGARRRLPTTSTV